MHSYYPDLSEPNPPVRCSSLRKTNSQVNNSKPSQIINRPLSTLPFSQETQQIPDKIRFHFSDATDDEQKQLCSTLVKYQHCHASHRNDLGKTARLLSLRLNSNTNLHTQSPTEVPINYREKS